MKSRPLVFVLLYCCLAVVALLAGCQPPPPKAAKEPVNVTVFRPVAKPDVVDYIYFTGHAKPVQVVDVKPRVSGYLYRVAFEKGGSVNGPSLKPIPPWAMKPAAVVTCLGQLQANQGFSRTLSAALLYKEPVEGDLLFEIDPRPYKATYDAALSQVALALAKYKSAEAVYKLNKIAADKGKSIGEGINVISPQALVTFHAAMVEAAASWKAAQASLESATIDLQFTRVTAPITGKITYNYLSRGNLVTKDQTNLARITTQNPMYVYFDIDEQTLQDIQILHHKGLFVSSILGSPVWAGLSKDKGRYPMKGVLDYVDPEVDPSMGSKTFRAVFDTHISEYLRSGNFVRVKLSKGRVPYPAPVVPEKALVAEQGNKYLLVCDADNKVRKELVKLGAQLDGGLQVILPPGKEKVSDQVWAQRWAREWVILDGVGEAQDKGDVVVSKRFQLELDTGKLLELKDTTTK